MSFIPFNIHSLLPCGRGSNRACLLPSAYAKSLPHATALHFIECPRSLARSTLTTSRKSQVRMKRIGVAIAAYGFAAVLSVLLMIWALQLPGVDLTMPFHYHGDGLLCAACTKGMTEQGWFLRNDALGMPYGMELYDFPLCDNLHLLGLKLLGSLVNPFTACNLYYLL